MLHPDPAARPSAQELVDHVSFIDSPCFSSACCPSEILPPACDPGRSLNSSPLNTALPAACQSRHLVVQSSCRHSGGDPLGAHIAAPFCTHTFALQVSSLNIPFQSGMQTPPAGARKEGAPEVAPSGTPEVPHEEPGEQPMTPAARLAERFGTHTPLGEYLVAEPLFQPFILHARQLRFAGTISPDATSDRPCC